MTVGIGLGPGTQGLATAETIRAFATLADDLGFAHFWVNDHVSWREAILDPFVLLSHIAAVTHRIHLATGVYLLPLRSPVVAARSLVSLDHLSGGRTIFGVGVGGEFVEDFAAVGVPIGERGRRMDRSLVILRRLLADDVVEASDEFHDFADVSVLPHPARGTIPIVVGGRSPAAIRRAADLGDGWMPYLMSPARVASGVAELQRAAQAAGRDAAKLSVVAHVFVRIAPSSAAGRATAIDYLSTQYKVDMTRAVDSAVAFGPPEACAEFLSRYREAGATDLVLRPMAAGEDQVETLATHGATLLTLLGGNGSMSGLSTLPVATA